MNEAEEKFSNNHAERPILRFIRIGIVVLAVPLSIIFTFGAGAFLGHLTGPWGSQELAALVLILCVTWPLFIFRRRRILAILALALILAPVEYLGYQFNDACTGSGGASHLCLPMQCEDETGGDHLLHPEGLYGDSLGLHTTTGTPCVEVEVSPLGRGLLAAKCLEAGFLTKTIAKCGG